MTLLRVVLIVVLAAASNPVVADLKIRFWSDRDDGESSLFVMNPDGSAPVNVKEAMVLPTAPAWSPVRTKIAFSFGRYEKSDIYVIDVDGSNLVNLSNKGGGDYSPRWSPDGTRVLWYGWPPRKGEGGARIFVNDADGSDLRDFGRGLWPRWSPDGTMIGLTLDGIVDTAFIVNADGSDRRAVTEHIVDTQFLSWSPDRTKIGLAKHIQHNSHKDLTQWCVYVIDIDGSNLVHLSKDLRNLDAHGAAWSRDGRKIAFYTNGLAVDVGDIFVVNADGTNRINLTEHHPRGKDRSPRWSRDGREILFETDRDGNREVYIMNADGTNPVNLTNHPADDGAASWFTFDTDLLTRVPLPWETLITTWGQIKAVASGK